REEAPGAPLPSPAARRRLPRRRRPALSARRAAKYPWLHLRRRLLRLAVIRDDGELLRRDEPRTGDRADDGAADRGGNRADAALRRPNRRVGVGRHRPLDLHRGVQRNRERHVLLGAPETRVAEADRPRTVDFAEVLHGTVRVRDGPLAPELVEAVALAVVLVAELLGKPSGVEMGTARAVLVDRVGVR